MHPNAIAAIAQELVKFKSELLLEDEPPIELSFPNDEWYMLGFNILFRRPETVAALAAFRKRFKDRPEWSTKWSAEYIARVESELIDEALAAHDERGVLGATERAVKALEAEAQERVVVLPIGGVVFGDFILSFPGIDVYTMNEKRLGDLRARYYAIVDSQPRSNEEKAEIRKQVDDRTGLLLNRVCAAVTTRGDRAFCLDDATRKAEPVVDLLQLMSTVFEPHVKRIIVRIGGDLVAKQPPFVVISTDGNQIYDEQKVAYEHRFAVGQSRLDDMKAHGFSPLVGALGKQRPTGQNSNPLCCVRCTGSRTGRGNR